MGEQDTIPNKPTADILTSFAYSPDDCEKAIRGLQVPPLLGHDVTRCCVIRGMRYHGGFGKEISTLLPEFSRAHNAGLIMADMIPEIKSAEEIPYCIWHPKVAKASTYRTLLEKYPSMKYQVGRACAVAGYTDLYKELNILPDCHIAEEAQDNGSWEIFQLIMSAPRKYNVMNDYTLKIESERPQEGNLNCDTATFSYLEIRRSEMDEHVPVTREEQRRIS